MTGQKQQGDYCGSRGSSIKIPFKEKWQGFPEECQERRKESKNILLVIAVYARVSGRLRGEFNSHSFVDRIYLILPMYSYLGWKEFKAEKNVHA